MEKANNSLQGLHFVTKPLSLFRVHVCTPDDTHVKFEAKTFHPKAFTFKPEFACTAKGF